MLILSQRDVVRLLPMAECIPLVHDALVRLAKGEAVQPLRSGLLLPGKRGVLGVMPGHLTGAGAGAKVITVIPANEGTPYDPHQGCVLLFEETHGQLVCVADASSITAIRTAAASAVATDLLARDDAGDIAIIGCGIQAETHLAAMLLVRHARRVRVWSRTAARAKAFAEREQARHKMPVELCKSAEGAVKGADIICTTTSAKTPIVKGEWLSPGAHINVVGSSVPTAREVDTDAVVRSHLFTDRRESCIAEAGEFIIAKAEGAIDDSHIQGEIGDLLTRRATGRTSPGQITMFKSLGIAVEDIASIHYVYAKAREQGVGVEVPEFGGSRAVSP